MRNNSILKIILDNISSFKITWCEITLINPIRYSAINQHLHNENMTMKFFFPRNSGYYLEEVQAYKIVLKNERILFVIRK